MKGKKTDLAVLAVCAASLAGLVVVYGRLPENIPVHWNFRSEVDGWGPRWTIFLMGALPPAIFLMMKAAPRFDPRREAYVKHAKAYAILTAVLSMAFIPISWMVAIAGLGIALDIGILVRVVIGALFIAIGNYLGKLRPNYFIGVRTPWTLSDPEVWKKTHRRGAWVFVGMGACMLASLLVPHSAAGAALVLASIVGGVAYLFVYSYFEWKALRS
ncbi:MAG: hypothetical protein A2Z99_05515 [Treponema sp. GWB1_62_6]|nr:MAG: hypothetical protein A2001_16880 [Treponema sp. GWC1_61_84]OHE70821.1 MAG: hypothetical protein A2Z99_05515 [Treponema sp. GWB1_62_6]OHE74588.1 MAG: hypothetical protein A2413_09795 [Treponema sp. RIFOXYC1_FULL_61_9]HCM28690.1 hypothetical protein [Treponema sp.]